MSDQQQTAQEAAEQLSGLSLQSSASQDKPSGTQDTRKSDSTSQNRAESLDWQAIARQAKTCADSLRSEQARTAAGTGNLINTCSNILNVTASAAPSTPDLLSAQTQLCRVVGNLVLDHPSNRQACLQVQIPQRILQVLTGLYAIISNVATPEQAHLETIKACTGALLNLTIDTPPIASMLYQMGAASVLQKSLPLYTVGKWADPQSEGAADPLTDVLTAVVAEWSLNVLKELFATEDATIGPNAISIAKMMLALPESRSAEPASQVNNPYAYQLLSSDLAILTSTSELLEGKAYDDTVLQETLAFTEYNGRSLLEGLVRLVEHAEILPAWEPVVKDDKATGDDSLEADKTFNTFKAEVARIAIAVCSSDKVMVEAFRPESKLSWLPETCKRWLEGQRSDLIITGSTMLANLARKDEYCVALVHQYDLSSALAAILRNYANPLSTTAPGEATQVLYGVVGLIRNLSIAGANKQALCDAGVIEPALTLLRSSLDMVVPLQNSAVGTLKHLCAGNISSSLKAVLPAASPGTSAVVTLSPVSGSNTLQGDSPVIDILALIARTNDVRLQCEATRLLVNIIRSLYSSRSITSPVTPSALGGLEMGLAKARARQILESNAGVVAAVSEMIRTGEKYPVLINEGIVALTLLSTTEKGAQNTLRSLTAYFDPATPAEDGAEPVSASSNSTSAMTVPQPNGYHRDRSVSRAVSLNPKNAPARSIDIVIRWLNSYAIAAKDMPAEMAGNALSLIEGVSRLPDSRELLPISEIVQCLDGIVRRDVQDPTGQVLKEVASRNLERLRSI